MIRSIMFWLGVIFCAQVVSANQTVAWSLPKKWHEMMYKSGCVKKEEITVTYQSSCEECSISFFKRENFWYQSVTVENERGIEYKRSLPIDIDNPVAQSLLTFLYGSVDSYIENTKLEERQDVMTIRSYGLPHKELFSYASSPTFNEYLKRKSSGLSDKSQGDA